MDQTGFGKSHPTLLCHPLEDYFATDEWGLSNSEMFVYPLLLESKPLWLTQNYLLSRFGNRLLHNSHYALDYTEARQWTRISRGNTKVLVTLDMCTTVPHYELFLEIQNIDSKASYTVCCWSVVIEPTCKLLAGSSDSLAATTLLIHSLWRQWRQSYFRRRLFSVTLSPFPFPSPLWAPQMSIQ
jgi:hypothetical protein